MKFSSKKNIFIVFLLLFVIFGFSIYFNESSSVYTKSVTPSYYNSKLLKETMSDMTLQCPNLLRQEGDMIMLYDLNQPGSNTNPAIFHNLAEYGQFVKEQQVQGIHCPVLKLQTQIVGSSISNASVTKPSSEENKIANYDKYDEHSKMGKFTKEDEVISDEISDNPMDPNWGGVQYSAQTLASGKYDGDMVTKPLYFNIRPNGTSFDPTTEKSPPPNYMPRDLLGTDITTTK